MIERQQLVNFIDETLNSARIKDYCPNGLQVEGKKSADPYSSYRCDGQSGAVGAGGSAAC